MADKCLLIVLWKELLPSKYQPWPWEFPNAEDWFNLSLWRSGLFVNIFRIIRNLRKVTLMSFRLLFHVPERSDADQNVSFEDLVKWKCWLSIAYGLWIAQNIFWLYFCHGSVHCFSAWEIRTKNLFMCVEHLFIWKYCIEFFSWKVPFI